MKPPVRRHAPRLASFVVACAAALSTASAGAAEFSVSSPTVIAGQRLPDTHVFNGFGCTGANRSPALQWRNAPAGTRSFAVTVYDPDAPTGSGWWHWVVFDIPADTRELVDGAGTPDGRQLPAGTVQGRTDFGASGFGGACPPAGDTAHRYRFTVDALDAPTLGAPPDASAAMIGFLIHAHRLASASIEAPYAR